MSRDRRPARTYTWWRQLGSSPPAVRHKLTAPGSWCRSPDGPLLSRDAHRHDESATFHPSSTAALLMAVGFAGEKDTEEADPSVNRSRKLSEELSVGSTNVTFARSACS